MFSVNQYAEIFARIFLMMAVGLSGVLPANRRSFFPSPPLNIREEGYDRRLSRVQFGL